MASSKDFLEFVLEQLSGIPDISYRAMMGEFVLYYHGTVVGGIYDNRLLIKPTKSIVQMVPHATMEIPYPGGKPMVMIPDPENRELLESVFNTVYSELPAPTKKSRK